MKVVTAHETGAEREVSYLTFKVLDFIEVPCPVERPLGGAAVTAQGDGVAQSFAELGEVPDATVLRAVIVAGGATDVLLKGDAAVLGVVEELFSDEHVCGKFFCGDAIQNLRCGWWGQ